jgi:hypothetical protein
MSYDYYIPTQVSYPDQDDDTLICLTFKTPSGKEYSFPAPSDDPEIASLLQKTFVYACMNNNTKGTYDFDGFKGTDEELPYLGNIGDYGLS